MDRLRALCRAYSRQSVLEAVEFALRNHILDPSEQRDLSAVITAALRDEDLVEAPPLSSDVEALIENRLKTAAN